MDVDATEGLAHGLLPTNDAPAAVAGFEPPVGHQERCDEVQHPAAQLPAVPNAAAAAAAPGAGGRQQSAAVAQPAVPARVPRPGPHEEYSHEGGREPCGMTFKHANGQPMLDGDGNAITCQALLWPSERDSRPCCNKGTCRLHPVLTAGREAFLEVFRRRVGRFMFAEQSSRINEAAAFSAMGTDKRQGQKGIHWHDLGLGPLGFMILQGVIFRNIALGRPDLMARWSYDPVNTLCPFSARSGMPPGPDRQAYLEAENDFRQLLVLHNALSEQFVHVRAALDVSMREAEAATEAAAAQQVGALPASPVPPAAAPAQPAASEQPAARSQACAPHGVRALPVRPRARVSPQAPPVPAPQAPLAPAPLRPRPPTQASSRATPPRVPSATQPLRPQARPHPGTSRPNAAPPAYAAPAPPHARPPAQAPPHVAERARRPAALGSELPPARGPDDRRMRQLHVAAWQQRCLQRPVLHDVPPDGSCFYHALKVLFASRGDFDEAPTRHAVATRLAQPVGREMFVQACRSGEFTVLYEEGQNGVSMYDIVRDVLEDGGMLGHGGFDCSELSSTASWTRPSSASRQLWVPERPCLHERPVALSTSTCRHTCARQTVATPCGSKRPESPAESCGRPM